MPISPSELFAPARQRPRRRHEDQRRDTIPFPVERVWDALLDPAVLVRTIPGCERLETTGEHTYAMTVTAGVAAIRGTYDGTCALSDLDAHESLVMRLQGAGAPGHHRRHREVAFADAATADPVAYDADAVVGGMVGGVGQRMLGSVSKRMAGEFFGNVASAIGGAPDGARRRLRRSRPPGRPPASARSSPPPRRAGVLAGGLPQGHRGRRRAGAARRHRRRALRPAAA